MLFILDERTLILPSREVVECPTKPLQTSAQSAIDLPQPPRLPTGLWLKG